MRSHVRVRGGYAARCASLLFGLFLFALGIVLILESELGLSPWDVLAQGVSNRTGMSFGLVTNLIGALVLLFWIPLRQRPGLGTVLNVLVVGPSAQLGLWIVPQQTEPVLQGLMFAAGLVLLAIATGLYIGARLGPGPRDGLMTGMRARTSWPIWAIRTGIEGSVLVVGWLLGGQVGIGTLAFVVLVGPLVHVALPLLRVPGGEPEVRASVRERRFDLSAWRPAPGDRDAERGYADLRAIAQREERVE